MNAVVNRAGQTQSLQIARELAGCTLLCADGEIGGIEAFLFDDTSWMVRYLVVTTGARLTGRRALIAPVAVGGVDTNNKAICIELTSTQIENSPPIDMHGRVSRQYEADYYNYYHWPPYWEAGPSSAQPQTTATGAGELRLRSTTELTGCAVAARDADIGYVDDIVVDTRYWAIRYLNVDAGDRGAGRHVLVYPGWVERVSWTDRRVAVDLVCHAIETAPVLDPCGAISRDDEARLFKHYGRPVYWNAGGRPGSWSGGSPLKWRDRLKK